MDRRSFLEGILGLVGFGSWMLSRPTTIQKKKRDLMTVWPGDRVRTLKSKVSVVFRDGRVVGYLPAYLFDGWDHYKSMYIPDLEREQLNGMQILKNKHFAVHQDTNGVFWSQLNEYPSDTRSVRLN